MNSRFKSAIMVVFVISLSALTITIADWESDGASTGDVFAYTYEEKTLAYKVVGNGQVEVTDYTAVSGIGPYTGQMTVPASFVYEDTTYTVVGIGDRAFFNSYGKVANGSTFTMPENSSSFTYIGDFAFDCIPIDFKIPDTVTSLGMGALQNTATTNPFTYNSQLITIGKQAFARCSNLTELDIPDGVTSIGSLAFNGCSH